MSLAARVQHRLTDYYGLDELPGVDSFLVLGQARERLIICLKDDAVELALQLPTAATGTCGPVGLDGLCQLIEGVSHFVLVAERNSSCKRRLTSLSFCLDPPVTAYRSCRPCGRCAAASSTVCVSSIPVER